MTCVWRGGEGGSIPQRKRSGPAHSNDALLKSTVKLHYTQCTALPSVLCVLGGKLFKTVQHTIRIKGRKVCLENVLWKGADMFQRARRTKKQAAGKGTSRYPNGIKSWPELNSISYWILMKIIFLRQKSCYLWVNVAIVWAIFGHFWHVFSEGWDCYQTVGAGVCDMQEPVRCT